MSALSQWNVDHTGMANSSELLVAKTHRRPGVRLGEVGGLPAAVLSTFSIKHRRLNPASMHDISIPDTNAMVEEPFHPLIYNGTIYDDDHNNVQIPVSSLHSSALNEGGADHKHLITAASKKVKSRNGKRRSSASGTLGKAGPSTVNCRHHSHSVRNQDEARAVDRQFDTESPEGFRESDLETSDCTKGAKDGSNAHMSPYLFVANASPLNRLDYHSRQPTIQFAMKPGHQDMDRSHYRESARNHERHVAARQDMPYHSNDRHYCCQVSIAHIDNADLKCRDHASKDSEQQSEMGVGCPSGCPFSIDGVDGWLQALGLGKYASLFNFHEVDCDVLPLLTFDDLKEMGISAVGTRRKMFFAIQQLRKGHKGASA